MLWRTRIVLVLLVAAATAITTPVAAQQQICLTLESQLAALERQNPTTVYQNLQAQYSQVQQAYNQTYAQAQQMGCIRLFQFNVPASCSGILAQLNSLETQLNALQQQLQQASPNQNAAARNNILRALAANNCGPQYAPYADQGFGNGGLLDRLFGVPQGGGAVGDGLIPLVTTYRTICVRGCDGYYFPLSFSTTPAHFETDQQICEAQCPGAQVYYYENPGATPETAVSLTGQPITAMPNAFAYRLAYYPECRCQPMTPIPATANYTPLTEDATQVIAAATPGIPLPVMRPDPSEDPETIANRFGGFTPGPFTLGVADTTAAMMVTDEGLRLIGPAYLYAQ